MSPVPHPYDAPPEVGRAVAAALPALAEELARRFGNALAARARATGHQDGRGHLMAVLLPAALLLTLDDAERSQPLRPADGLGFVGRPADLPAPAFSAWLRAAWREVALADLCHQAWPRPSGAPAEGRLVADPDLLRAADASASYAAWRDGAAAKVAKLAARGELLAVLAAATPGQAALLRGLADGLTPREVAERNGIAWPTARVQLHRLRQRARGAA